MHVSVHNKQEGLLPDRDSKTTIATTDNIDFLQSHASVNSGIINSVVTVAWDNCKGGPAPAATYSEPVAADVERLVVVSVDAEVAMFTPSSEHILAGCC